MKFPDEDYFRRADSVVENSIKEAASPYIDMANRFARILADVDSFEDARQQVERRAVDDEFIDSFSALMVDGVETMDAIARTQLVEKDTAFSRANDEKPAKFRGDAKLWFICTNGVKVSFSLTPEEVVRILRERTLWISGVENDAVLKFVQTGLETAAAEGRTYRQFLESIESVLREKGLGRIHTVFRTNLFSAFSQAQLDQIVRMPGRFPLWRYLAILDSVTRPSHAALDGALFAENDGPYPPIDFNCRCTAQHLHKYEVEADRLRASESVNFPDVRFDFRNGIERYIADKQTSMNPRIVDAIRRKT